eukprot:jgi/Ulvmu1/10738/UM068_0026.1
MAPRKGKVTKKTNVKKTVNPWDVVQTGDAPRGSVKVIARPCPILDVVNLGKRKARFDASVELCKNGTQQMITLNIQDGRHKSKAKNQNQFELPWVAPETTQAEMYDCVKPVVNKFLDQRTCDCAILAYGATGSGKTYSMQGPKRVYLEAVTGIPQNTVEAEDGILQRCLKQLFQRRGDAFVICISAVEIYKEKIRDLLVPGARWGDKASECEIMSLDAGQADCGAAGSHRTAITGQIALRHRDKTPVREVRVGSVHETMHALSDALQSRTCRETKKNAESSRSHMLIGVSLCKPPLQARLDGTDSHELTKMATLWLGDLCGAEAFDLAAGTAQQAETRSINQSLLSFTSCLQTLWRNQQLGERGVAPVRDSALTRILADVMHGVGHLALSTHFSLRDADLEQTRRTLAFAAQVTQLQFESGMRLRQQVHIDSGAACDVQLGAVPSEGAAVTAHERPAAAERRAAMERALLELPELLRQRDRLAEEVAQLKESAREREEAAREAGVEEGLRIGREEAEEGGGGAGEADAAQLQLDNEDWQLRLEEAVHAAKVKMNAQMCTQIEQMTARAGVKQAELHREVFELRRQLRKAGLLQRPGARLPRRTLVRVPTPDRALCAGNDDGADTAEAIPEEEEEKSGSDSGADTGDSSSGEGGDDEEAAGGEPAAEQAAAEGEVAAETDALQEQTEVRAAGEVLGQGECGSEGMGRGVQSGRGGYMAHSISEVNGAPAEGRLMMHQPDDHAAMDTALANATALAARLQSERDGLLREQEAAATREAERAEEVAVLKRELEAARACVEDATLQQSAAETALREARAQVGGSGAAAGGEHANDMLGRPSITLERYQQVLQEALAEASEDGSGDDAEEDAPPAVVDEMAAVDYAPGAAGGSPVPAGTADPGSGDAQTPSTEDGAAADDMRGVTPGVGTQPSGAVADAAVDTADEVVEEEEMALECEASAEDFGNVSFAPSAAPSSAGSPGAMRAAGADAAEVAAEEAAVQAQQESAAAAAASRAAPRRPRTELQQLLAAVPISVPQEAPGALLLGAGRNLTGGAQALVRPRSGRRGRMGPKVGALEAASALVAGGAGGENRLQPGRKGKAAMQGPPAPAASRALRARRNQ